MTTADEEAVRFTSEPTTAEVVLNAIAVTRESLVMLGGGTFVTILGGVSLILFGDASAIGLVVIGIGLITGLLLAPFALWSVRRRGDLYLSPVDVEADAAGIAFTSRYGSSRYEWAVFRRVRETGRAFVLDTGAGPATVLSKRGANPGQLTAFRRLLSDRTLLMPSSASRTVIQRIGAVAIGAGLAGAILVGPSLLDSVTTTARIDAGVSVSGSTVSIEGSTDLPDGTIVGIQVFHRDEWERELADGVQPSMDDWPWQSYEEILVQDGRIRSTASVAGWPAGRGLVVAYFWVDGRQPAAVIDRFGRDGAGLRGSDVVDDPRNGRTLEVSAPFEIGR